MIQVVEAVPNFSEGRDPAFVAAAADAFAATGCEVLHTTLDPDHHRSVVTVIGSPGAVERGSLAAAEVALERIDLQRHRGVHPRVGALDVLPFVPLHGIDMAAVVPLARRVAHRIARLGIPVHFYARASRPFGRTLAAIRRSGPGRPEADLPGLDGDGRPVHTRAHPTAGATCIGARDVLLAWNVDVEGLSLESAREIAARIREVGGGFPGLRALALRLPRQQRMQISMNLEDPIGTHPTEVFRAIKRRVRRMGGAVQGTEVIGMCPDQLADPAIAREMRIRDWSENRVLGHRLRAFVGGGNG
ncbi:MAG: glutamate formiminotransferase [Gemmatimonadetes bacterium]|nr:glutamate formiminotransferase [Gemmatimonadota bacterium]MYB05115.1 glutamate formiminotransferase [Gemmatimonadota bacterium]MYE15079.1 glutamate formiminotransferase [Gemmatimonadota bacterium]MYG23610.1 glutamate formiminotransferase [Gemmatimonadota bacterium]MYJ39267.1 glutamate formiminotransferase [Gemmatimonadota bacterium]